MQPPHPDSPPTPSPRPPSLRAPSLRALALAFAAAGLLGFGGVLPWARYMIVDRRRWLGPAEFTDLLALCQFLPGPNVVNLSVALGTRYHGWRGAAACLAGLLAAPVVIAVGLGGLYAAYGSLPVVQGAFEGLAAAGAGLLLATALRIAWPLRTEPLGLAVAALALFVVAVLRAPMLPTMLVLAPVSMALHRWPWRLAK